MGWAEFRLTALLNVDEVFSCFELTVLGFFVVTSEEFELFMAMAVLITRAAFMATMRGFVLPRVAVVMVWLSSLPSDLATILTNLLRTLRAIPVLCCSPEVAAFSIWTRTLRARFTAFRRTWMADFTVCVAGSLGCKTLRTLVTAFACN